MVGTCTDVVGQGGGNGDFVGEPITAQDGDGDDFTRADMVFLESAGRSAEAAEVLRRQKMIPEIGRPALFPMTYGEAFPPGYADVATHLADPYSVRYPN